MGRELGHKLVVIKTERDYEEIFDEDFLSNEEYFRPDTLRLGYRNEAERYITEHKKKNDGVINIHHLITKAFCDSYYLQYEYEIEYIGDATIVSISYMTQ